jgi:hypothetical protein
MTAKQVCLALNFRGNKRQNRRDLSFFVRVAVIAVSTIRGHRNSGARSVYPDRFPCTVCRLTRTNREPGGKEVPANLCHRDKDYGNWNKNEPVFKIPVVIYQALKLHRHRCRTLRSKWTRLLPGGLVFRARSQDSSSTFRQLGFELLTGSRPATSNFHVLNVAARSSYNQGDNDAPRRHERNPRYPELKEIDNEQHRTSESRVAR